MKVTKIKETCIYHDNLEEIREFYHGCLGLAVIGFLPGKHIFFRAGDCVLLCFNASESRHKVSPPAHFGEGKIHFAFEVNDEDYVSAKEELRMKGIRITDEVKWPSGKESFYFEDPAGNVLEIVPRGGIWD